MLEFFQAYGSWILFGLFFLIMLRMHGSGGCGMGHKQHTDEPARRPTDADGVASNTEAGGTPVGKARSGGCH